jgi:hypothetical protein
VGEQARSCPTPPPPFFAAAAAAPAAPAAFASSTTGLSAQDKTKLLWAHKKVAAAVQEDTQATFGANRWDAAGGWRTHPAAGG